MDQADVLRVLEGKLPWEVLQILIEVGKNLPVRAGKNLCFQGDPSDKMYLVTQGKVELIKYRSDGSSFSTGLVHGGEWVGLAEALLDIPFLHDAFPPENIEVVVFTKQSLARLLSQPLILQYWLRVLARSYYTESLWAEYNMPVTRIANFLLNYAVPRHGTEKASATTYYGTQEEIALGTGYRRETVNRYLRELEAEGIITLGKGKVHLKDPGALQKRLDS